MSGTVHVKGPDMTDASHPAGSPSRRISWKWLVAAFLAAVVIGAAIDGVTHDFGNHKTVAPSQPTATTGPVSSASAPPGASPLSVVAGSGGRTKGADGITPLGYTDTCVGAVQAATNYAAAMARLALGSPSYGEALIAQMAASPIDGSLTSEQSLEAQQVSGGASSVAHPEWGAFRLDDCVPGTTATVSVWVCTTASGLGLTISGCRSTTMHLSWLAASSTWAWSSFVPWSPPSVANPIPTTGSSAAPVTAATRRTLIAATNAKIPAGQPMWQEYANAPH